MDPCCWVKNSPVWHKNMLGHLPTHMICSEKWAVYLEHSFSKTASFKEQTTSKDKLLGEYFPTKRGLFCLFFATWAVLKIEQYHSLTDIIFTSFS